MATKAVYVDDKFDHLLSDILKMRKRHNQYVSFNNELGAKSITLEIINNALDECRNPRSPGNAVEIIYDERIDTITVSDNGRGIPTSQLETLLTTLNSGSNLDSADKSDLKADILGRNGTGTLAYCALSERLEVTTYRGGTENVFKRMVFVEGEKVEEESGKCSPDKHGYTVTSKPSKILGKKTRIVWSHIHDELINLQFLMKKKVNVSSTYINESGVVVNEKYKSFPFDHILAFRNPKEGVLTDRVSFLVEDDNIIEEVGGSNLKRFISMDVAFMYTRNSSPYIDSFCNRNNTIENGSHLDGVRDALCRYLQTETKASLTEKEKDKLDIKWDDVRTGLSIAVALRTDMERIFTNQSKHRIFDIDFEKTIREISLDTIKRYFEEHPAQLKELIGVVKINARARREGERERALATKETITEWKEFSMKNYTPCTNKGKEYKELFIVEGDSAKGSLKNSRDPVFQALFAIRGVSANVFKMTLEQVMANEEFKALISLMRCGIGNNFNLSKLYFDKIIIASDADVDGLFIRSLLCSFFIKLFPEIIEAGKLFIAEPPLYRVDDAKNPFVINKDDNIDRYIKNVLKEYNLAFYGSATMLSKSELRELLDKTSGYRDLMKVLSEHYKVNDRLIEIIFQEAAKLLELTGDNVTTASKLISKLDPVHLMTVLGEEFSEIFYDDSRELIYGIIDGKRQSLFLTERLIRKGLPNIKIISQYNNRTDRLVLKHSKTGVETHTSLMGALKMLKKFQPNIIHRFKGLGENSGEDIRTTIMDPNTRSLIRLKIGDIENDMKVFHTLRGSSPQDALNRKLMMKSYRIDPALIDT